MYTRLVEIRKEKPAMLEKINKRIKELTDKHNETIRWKYETNLNLIIFFIEGVSEPVDHLRV